MCAGLLVLLAMQLLQRRRAEPFAFWQRRKPLASADSAQYLTNAMAASDA